MITFAAVLTPMRASVGAGLFTISVVGNISYFSFGLLAPLSGHLADRIGSRAVLAAGLGGMAVSLVAVALAPNLYVLAAALAALGLSAAVYHPAGLSLIARRVAAVEKGMAYHGIFGSVGVAVGPLLAGLIMAGSSWRWVYAALAVPVAALALTFFLGAGGRSVAGKAPAATRFPARTQMGALVVYYLVALAIGFVYHGGTTFLPTRLGEMKGLFLGNAATTATLLFGVIGQYIGGAVAARRRLEPVLAAAMAAAGAGLFLLGCAAGPLLLPPAALFGLAYFATQPVTNTLIARLTSARRQGLAYGVNFFLTFGLGSLGTSFTGFIGERLELGAAFRVLGIVGWASVPAVFLLWWLRRSAAAKPAVIAGERV